MLKFARRRARSSEREPVKCVVMNNCQMKPRASSAERPTKNNADSSETLSNVTVTVPSITPSIIAARTASIQKASPRRSCVFEDNETDSPIYSITVTDSPMLTNPSKLIPEMEALSVKPKHEIFSPPITPGSGPIMLPRKPKFENILLQQRHLWKMELLDTSAESGYGTDSSDNNSMKSVASASTVEDTSPPPLPRRKPRRRVQFDSYVLLIQSLKERDLKGIVSTIFNVSSEALCTEDVIYHFHTAILRQDYETFELLVRGGVEVNTFDHRGWSALHCACSLARLDMIKLLLQNGAAVLARTHHSSQTGTQLLPVDNPAYPQCLAYIRCMEECLGTVNNRLVLAAANYRASRLDEMSITKGDRLNVIRRGDVNNEMWWWVKNARGEEGYVLRDLLSLNSRHS